MQPTNRQSSRPLPSLTIGLWTASLLIAAALTGYFGLYAAGYLVPAACLLLQATLLFSGRGKTAFVTIMALNQISGLVLVLVLAFGDALGGVGFRRFLRAEGGGTEHQGQGGQQGFHGHSPERKVGFRATKALLARW